MTDFKKATAGPFFFTDDPGLHMDDGSTLAAGFRPDAAITDASVSLGPSLAGKPGVHLFLKCSPGLPPLARFETELRRLLDDPAYWNSRILWIENPADLAVEWRVRALAVETVTTASTTTSAVQRTAFLDFRNFSLCIPRGSTIEASTSGKEIVIRKAGGAGFYLTAGNGAHRLHGIGDEVTVAVEGTLAGCLRFELALDPTRADLRNLDASFRIFHKDSFFPATDADFFVGARRYPFLEEATPPALTLFPTLDPLNHLDTSRTYFSFVNPSATAAVPNPVPSGFRTTFGAGVQLTPRDHGSRLVFDVRPVSSKAGRNDPYYLTPMGEFDAAATVAAGQAAAAVNLLCGFSGVEFVKLPAGGTRFVFTPKQPAFAPGFAATEALSRRLMDLAAARAGHTEDEADLEMDLQRDLGIDFTLNPADVRRYFPNGFPSDPSSLEQLQNQETVADVISWMQNALQGQAGGTELLNDFATTSWAWITETAPAVPVYYTQPDEAVFYRAVTNTGDEFLESMEVPAVPLFSTAGASPAPAFPMLPYGGVRGPGLADYRILEHQVISPLRRQRIHDIYATFRKTGPEVLLLPAGTAGTTAPRGVTPQGLLVDFSADFEKWSSLLLGKDAAKTPSQLRITDLGRDSQLRAALQSNNLFLVISDPGELKTHFPEHEAAIAGWKFSLDPAQWEKSNTILIFKYQDRPLRDLVEQTAQWALPQTFNKNVDDTRRRLSQLMRDALTTATADAAPMEKEKWRELTRAALNPQWSGILALNVPVDLPKEVSGLAAGIKANPVTARYFGIDSTPVVPKNGVLEAGASSLFGLIDYSDHEPPEPSDSGFNFQVTSLTGVFRNSALTSFSAELQVTLDKLFGEDTELAGGVSGRNIVVLKGTSEDHGGHTTYSFSFTGDNEFALPASSTIQEVEILKAAFSSDPPLAAPSDWKVGQAGHAAGATAVAITGGTTNPKKDDVFEVKGDTQTYTVVSFASGTVTYTPAAKTAFATGSALAFGVFQSARFTFWGNMIFRAWTASSAAPFRVTQADHAVGATKVAIDVGSSLPAPGDKVEIGSAAQVFTITTFKNGSLQFTPAASAGFPLNAAVRKLDSASASLDLHVTQTDHAANATTVTVNAGAAGLQAGDLLSIGGQDKVYTVSGVADDVLTYGPAAGVAFARDAVIHKLDPAALRNNFRVSRANHAAGSSSVEIDTGVPIPGPGQAFLIGDDDDQAYVVSEFSDGILTYAPPVQTAFAHGSRTRRVDPVKAFDVLSFGPNAESATNGRKGLRFANLVLVMQYQSTHAKVRNFTFDPGKLSFDLKKSSQRRESLYAKFPLKLTGFSAAGANETPQQLGYLPVKTPLGGSAPGGAWYGLHFDLELGSVGALAGKAGLVVSILAAWSPGPTGGGVFVGLRLPGSSGGKKELTIQGLIKIAFKSMQFQVGAAADIFPTHYSYVLKLRNIVLRFLVFSFPPKAQTEIIIFGDPGGATDPAAEKTLGWYAAYLKGSA